MTDLAGLTDAAIADLLDQVALDLVEALTPAPDDPDRARKTVVVGIASFAVINYAEWLRKTGRHRQPEARDAR